MEFLSKYRRFLRLFCEIPVFTHISWFFLDATNNETLQTTWKKAFTQAKLTRIDKLRYYVLEPTRTIKLMKMVMNMNKVFRNRSNTNAKRKIQLKISHFKTIVWFLIYSTVNLFIDFSYSWLYHLFTIFKWCHNLFMFVKKLNYWTVMLFKLL